ncbi:Hypothetical predicted protein, partial [Olea europaea subsp. europaea]
DFYINGVFQRDWLPSSRRSHSLHKQLWLLWNCSYHEYVLQVPQRDDLETATHQTPSTVENFVNSGSSTKGKEPVVTETDAIDVQDRTVELKAPSN